MSAHVVKRQRLELQKRIASWLDVPLSVLSLIMVGLLIADLSVTLSPTWERRVSQAETAIWIIFLGDFVLEFALAPSKTRYLKKNWLTAISVALPALRVVRVLRAAQLLRGLSLARMLTTLNRGSRALTHVVRRGQLGYVLALTLIVTVTAAAGTFYFEHSEPRSDIQSFGDALWWAATIVTTINVSLETTTLEGHIIGLLLRFFALTVTGYLTAIIAVYLLGEDPRGDNRTAEHTDVARLQGEIAQLREAVERLAARESPHGSIYTEVKERVPVRGAPTDRTTV